MTADPASTTRTHRYRFAPLHRPGVVAGFRGGQLAVVAGGLVAAVGAIRWSASLAGLVGATLAVTAAILAATWPVGGRTAEEWAPDAVRFALGQRHGRWRPGNPLGWLHVLAAEVAGAGEVGVIVDRRRGAMVACLPVACPGFLLAAPEERDRRVADWAAALAAAGAAGSAIRVQWIERAVPDAATGHLLDLAARHRLPADAPAHRSYRDLVARVGAGACSHGVVLAIAVHGSSRRRRRLADSETGTVLLQEVAAMRRRLLDAGIDAGPPLDPGALARYLRSATAATDLVATDAMAAVGGPTVVRRAPSSGRATAAAGCTRPGWPAPPASDDELYRPAGTDWWPWPTAVEEQWSRLRTDATWHAVYWVAQWPRRDVPADFLAALLLSGRARRTVSVVMEPVPTGTAARQVERARTSEVADRELRRRGGFLATVRWQRQAQALAEREAELADGHVAFRFSGYVAVTADAPEALDDACQEVEQAATAADLELRRCYGSQAEAFMAVLPTTAGLP